MHPVLFHVGGFAVPAYGAALSLAFAAGIAFAALRAPARGIPRGTVVDVGLWILLSSLVGARLFWAASHLDHFRAPEGSPLDVFRPRRRGELLVLDGLSVMGGLPVALLVAFLVLRHRRLPVARTLDLLAPSVALGAAITRVGCFLNGCCFGTACAWPWGVRFPAGSLPERVLGSVALHPTQLYHALAALAILGALLWIDRRRAFDGAAVLSLCALMGLQRIAIESLRFREPSEILLRHGGTTWSVYQAAALALLVFGSAGLAWEARRARRAAAHP